MIVNYINIDVNIDIHKKIVLDYWNSNDPSKLFSTFFALKKLFFS